MGGIGIDQGLGVARVRVSRCFRPPGDKGIWWGVGPWTLLSFGRDGAGETQFHGTTGLPTLRRPKGAAACFPPQARWRTRALSPDGLHLTYARMAYFIFPGVDLLSFLEIPVLFPPETWATIGDTLDALADMNTEPGDELRRLMRHQELSFRLLGAVLAVAPPRPEVASRLAGLPRFGPVLDYLGEHFAEPVSVQKLAGIAGLSQGQFHRRFKALTDTSPYEYVKRLRLQLAADLLHQTDLPVAEVGARSGWPDPFHFSRMFKAVFAQSPSTYRQHKDSQG